MKRNYLIIILFLFSSCGNRIKCDKDEHVVSTQIIAANNDSLVRQSDWEERNINQSLSKTTEILYRNSDLDYYGNLESCYDSWLIEIDKVEYLAAFDRYKNVCIDTIIRLPYSNETFFISLSNGDVKEISNRRETTDAMAEYQFVGYLPKLHCYKFAYSGFEWEGFLYVSKKTGKEYIFKDELLFSPNNELCVTVRLEQEGIDQAGTIEVYQIVQDEFVFLFGLWSEKILPKSACWYDNSTLYIETTYAENSENDSHYYKICLDKISNK